MQLKQALSLFLVLVLFSTSHSQELVWKRFGPAKGLCGNELYSISQDDHHNIWVSSTTGLSKFNGTHFSNFSSEDGLCGDEILQIHVGKKGELYFFSANGKICQGDPFLKTFRNIYSPDPHEVKGGFFYGFYQDDITASAFIGSRYGGLFRMDSTGVKRIPLESWNEYQFSAGKVKVDMVSIGPVGGALLDAKSHKVKKQFRFKKVLSRGLIKNQQVYGCDQWNVYIIEDGEFLDSIPHHLNSEVTFLDLLDSNKMVIGSKKGFRLLDLHSRILSPAFLSEYSISAVMLDHEKGLWATTLSNGLFYSPYPSSRYLPDLPPPQSISRSDSLVFIGHKNGVATILDPAHSTLTVPVLHGQPNMKIVQIQQHRDQWLFGLESRIVIMDSDKPLIVPLACREFEAVDSGLVFVNYLGFFFIDWLDLQGLNQIPLSGNRRQDFILEHRILAGNFKKVKVKNGKVYVSGPNGLYLFRSGRHKSIYKGAEISDFVIHDNKAFILEYTLGLVVVDLTNSQKRKEIKFGDTRYHNKIRHMGNMLWITSSTGILVIPDLVKPNESILMEQLNGFEYSFPKDALLLPDGNTLVTYENATCIFPPFQHLNQVSPPSLYVDEIRQDDLVLVDHKAINLDHDKNSLRFFLSSPSFKVLPRFEYAISDEFPKSWSSSNFSPVFPNLAPGSYKIWFRSVAGTESSSALAVQFRILPPFWATWWFRALITGVVGLLIYLFFRIRVLTYNRDLVREILAEISKKVKGTKSFTLKTIKGDFVKIYQDELLWISASNVYMDVHTSKGLFVSRIKMKELEERLKEFKGVKRIHRSYIANLSQLDGVNKNQVIIRGQRIPFSPNYKPSIQRALQSTRIR